MIVEILLGLILAALVAVAVILHGIDRRLVEWRDSWATLPSGATDYHSKELLNVVQEIAHYLAIHPQKRLRSENDNTNTP